MNVTRAICCLVLAALELTPAPATAAESPEASLEQAISLYRRGEFDRSLAGLQKLVSLPRLRGPLHARAELYLGLNLAAINDLDGARRHLREALRLDPSLELDRSHQKAAVVEIVDQLRWELRGMLVVEASPGPARVEVDGHSVGHTPYRGEQALGAHELVVHPPPGSSSLADRRRIVVGAGSTLQVRVQLLLSAPASVSTSAPVALEIRRPAIPARRARRPLRLAAWIAGGAALAASGAAIGLGVTALERRDDADAFARAGSASSGEDQRRHRELVDSSERMVLGTNLSWGLAGGLALTSAVLFLWDHLRSR